jgi:hypothetical protein
MRRPAKSRHGGPQARMLTSRVCETAFLLLILPVSSHAQQIASVDLAHPRVVHAGSDQDQENVKLPENCGRPGVSFADGEVVNDDLQPRKIEVEFITVSNTRLVAGENVEGTVRLQNVGDKPIQIPWSTDFRTTQNGEDPNLRSWEVAGFRIALLGAKNNNVGLKSTSQVLFASKLVFDSTLTVKSGEWITAQISFKVEPQEGTHQQVTPGQFELFVEWSQTAYTREIKNCGLTLGNYSYSGVYRQSNPRIAVTVENEPHDTTKKGSKQPSN